MGRNGQNPGSLKVVKRQNGGGDWFDGWLQEHQARAAGGIGAAADEAYPGQAANGGGLPAGDDAPSLLCQVCGQPVQGYPPPGPGHYVQPELSGAATPWAIRACMMMRQMSWATSKKR
jgi:hypothetical protein